MNTTTEKGSAGPEPLERPTGRLSVPEEGSDGLFTQSWFPICLSTDVPKGTVISRDFLDGQVAVFRGDDSEARVVSAYCLHMGVNLGNGDVIGNELRCPFHHWAYNGEGQCVRTGVGDEPPERARLFSFPTEERFGIIFAFNGVEPLYPFPDLLEGSEYSEDELLVSTHEDLRFPWPVDPWAIRGNTPDWAHFACVHHMEVDRDNIPDPNKAYRYDKYKVNFRADVNLDAGVDHDAADLVYNAQITGTTLWHNQGEVNGRWNMMLSALGIPKPGTSNHFYVVAVHEGDGSAEEEAGAREFLAESIEMWERMVLEDRAFAHNQHYRPGLLTKADAAVAKFLHYVKGYPRAHPARNFMR